MKFLPASFRETEGLVREERKVLACVRCHHQRGEWWTWGICKALIHSRAGARVCVWGGGGGGRLTHGTDHKWILTHRAFGHFGPFYRYFIQLPCGLTAYKSVVLRQTQVRLSAIHWNSILPHSADKNLHSPVRPFRWRPLSRMRSRHWKN